MSTELIGKAAPAGSKPWAERRAAEDAARSSGDQFGIARALLYRCLAQLPKNTPLAKEIKSWMERNPAP